MFKGTSCTSTESHIESQSHHTPGLYFQWEVWGIDCGSCVSCRGGLTTEVIASNKLTNQDDWDRSGVCWDPVLINKACSII